MPCIFRSLICRAVLVAIFAASYSLRADDSLAHRIDTFINAKVQGPSSSRTNDAEFVRRVYLDLAGRIPSADETRAFLADGAADKRAKLIDQRLAGSDYPQRMADLFHVMLMERLGENVEWTKFLRESFAANKPWEQLVREIIYADATNEATRGSAFFLSKRLENYGQNPVDYPGMVRDVGRMFLGVDVQCCQCHDHLYVKDYKQDYYQGLFAFLGQTYLRNDVKFPAVAEKPVTKKVEFTSVFVKQPREVGPKLPGADEVLIPSLAAGEEWLTPPDKKANFPGVPKFSPLKTLSEQLPRKENAAFTRNAVNRLWWVMMGRGLVHPLDLHHSDNPPSHPEVLDLLAQEFTAHNCDVKWLLRELALTETYQRSSAAPEGVAVESVPPESYRVALEKPLSTEQMLLSLLVATGELPRVKGATDSSSPEFDKLLERFAKALANPPREPETEFTPSVKATLFLSNDETVLSWLQPRPGNLVERLAQIAEPEKLVDELFLSVLTRLPSAEERTDAIAYLTKVADRRSTAIGHLAWALATSTEFSVNH